MYLRQIDQEVQHLKGVGPKSSVLLNKMGIHRVYDLLTHYPRDYIDRSHITPLSSSLKLEKATVAVKVIAHDFFGRGAKQILKIYVEDESSSGVLLCFGRTFLKNTFIPGTYFLVTGTFKYKYGEIQCSNFEFDPLDGGEDFKKIIPIYPLTLGVTQKFLRKLLEHALLLYGEKLENELPLPVMERFGLKQKEAVLKMIHFPISYEDVVKARNNLIFEELFYLQLTIGRKALKRKIRRKARAPVAFRLKNELLARLPFRLTDDQARVIEEMEQELFSPYPMARLVQGDVGCGKTLVAVITALSVIEAGMQAAFLAPTELLAEQHAENIAALTAPLGIHIAFLSGSLTTEARKLLLEALVQGEIDMVVGTHALFSEDVKYKNLGYVIIDEQHKFGVLQRLAIMAKGNNPDLLLMTATPIPRTLALTAFGDLETSEIKTMPPGRKSIITHLAREGNEEKVYNRVSEELKKGRQAYFVYPLIEESEKIDLKDTESMFKTLKEGPFKNYRLGLIHSRIDEECKRETMEAFTKGKIDILIATSVVEVGVDVPNATVIVIEHAERFGLSALHQLRGRVGRGQHQSYAFLIYAKKLTEEGIRRLKVMKETTDGFQIAEEDLKIRGPGELLGVRQSGFLRLKSADLTRDRSILLKARKEAFSILQEDPGLLKPENRVIREVLEKAPPFDEAFLNGG